MFIVAIKSVFNRTIKSCLLLAIILFSNFSLAKVVFVGGSNGVEAENLPQNAVSIRLSGPNDFYQETKRMRFYATSGLLDGQYSFEIYGQVVNTTENIERNNKVRGDAGRTKDFKSTGVIIKIIESGYFRISNGSVVNSRVEKRISNDTVDRSRNQEK
ncbi:hypothetical protein N9872_02340 [Paraglaciecola sp.]|nr:hypothetical protein [Paraglaciecola sp.]MDB4281795.1 hypothetical protein [Paraglaciecola sp.]